MRKLLIMILSLVLASGLAALAACNSAADDPADDPVDGPSGGTQTGEPDDPSEPEEPDEPDEPSGGEEQPDEPDEPVADGSVLVVYFSATGNTEQVANYIAEYMGGDIFELVPVEPYTSADLRWTDDNSRVVHEYAEKQAGTLETVELTDVTVENWENYDTVFLGFPIWWYEAAWPVYDFVESNDFTGKTIYTFCTSSSSGLGDSTEVLAAMAGGNGTWLNGRRFSSSASQSTVESWLDTLNLI